MKPDVSVVGLGYIGLPTSLVLSGNKIKVAGIDINKEVVNQINKGQLHIVEPGLDELLKVAIADNYFKAYTETQAADVYLIVVPTPFKGNNKPDISYVEKATNSVLPLLKANDLLIIESTCPIGTTDHIARMIFDARPELKEALSVAYCPERVLPGNIIYELVNNDRVIGGIDALSTKKAIAFYKRFVKGELHPTNAKTAEMCKLVENSSRDVQIAFANELSIICDKAGINAWELIKLANKHPRVNILTPGCGVGGHCIAVDPYFIVSEYPLESRIIGKAREINNYKAFWCVEKTKNAILEFKSEHGRTPSVALMGLSYKPDNDDLRESPAVYISKRLINDHKDSSIYVVEPNLQEADFCELTEYDKAVQEADIIVFLVKHSAFKDKSIANDKIILDFCGVTQ